MAAIISITVSAVTAFEPNFIKLFKFSIYLNINLNWLERIIVAGNYIKP
jgi:hypothetical protein